MSSWLDKYKVTEQLGHEIMELINERNNLKRSGANVSKLQSSVRVKLQSYSSSLHSLKDMLLQTSSSYNVTQQELQRRQNQLDILVSKEQQLNQAFNPSHSIADRTGLFNDSFADSSRQPWGNSAHDEDDMTTSQFMQKKQEVIRDQDEGLEALSQVIQRQKLMGQAIGDEINYQNDLIDDVADGVDKVNSKLGRTEKLVKKVNKKSGSCVMMVIIVLLLIVIVVVAVY